MQTTADQSPVLDGRYLATLVERLDELGWARGDIEWSENIAEPDNAEDFASEAIWVICNSGMKHTVARLIQERVNAALAEGRPVFEVFRHPGKAAAMQEIWINREDWFRRYREAGDKLAFCASMPWIGGITKYHLAKNYGADVAKPDVHLARLAAVAGETVQGLCERLAGVSGYRVATVDLILWRACATGVVDSRTGVVLPTG